MQLQVNYIRTHSTGGDGTAPYDIVLNRDCTLGELIEYILTRNESGTIRIQNICQIEYRGEYIITTNEYYRTTRRQDYNSYRANNSGLLNRIIVKVDCVGGWGSMDYYIEIQ